MTTLFGREPSRWIGLIVALVVAILRVLVGDELISQAQADALNDAVAKIADVVLLIVPFLTAELIRRQVTPVAAPALPQGTTVTVVTPGDLPNHTTTI
jgi:hypothetical protein